MKSRFAWLLLGLMGSVGAWPVHAQPAAEDTPTAAPAGVPATPAKATAPAKTTAAANSAGTPTVGPETTPLAAPVAAPGSPPAPGVPLRPRPAAVPLAARPAAVQSAPAPAAAPNLPPAALPPPKFAVPPPQVVYVANTPPPEPERRYGNAGAPFAIGIGGALRFRSDRGFGQLDSAHRQRELDVFASYDVFQPVRRVVLAAGINYRRAAFGDPDSLNIQTHALQADVIVRYTLARWLFPQLRAGLGAQLSRAKLHDDLGRFSARDRSAGATGSVGAGLLFQTPRRTFETRRGRLASLSLGLLVEGGYAFASAVKYRLKPKSDGDLPTARIELGKLDLGGAYLRIVGVVRF